MEMTIGELSRRSGVPASTIRYYEDEGLIPRPARASGRRVFDESTLDRLLLVECAKEAGFSLRDIRQLFDGFSSGTPAGTRWKALATAKLAEVEAQAVRIKTMKKLLEEALCCGCVDLTDCGKLLQSVRSRAEGSSTRGGRRSTL